MGPYSISSHLTTALISFRNDPSHNCNTHLRFVKLGLAEVGFAGIGLCAVIESVVEGIFVFILALAKGTNFEKSMSEHCCLLFESSINTCCWIKKIFYLNLSFEDIPSEEPLSEGKKIRLESKNFTRECEMFLEDTREFRRSIEGFRNFLLAVREGSIPSETISYDLMELGKDLLHIILENPLNAALKYDLKEGDFSQEAVEFFVFFGSKRMYIK